MKDVVVALAADGKRSLEMAMSVGLTCGFHDPQRMKPTA